jgi:hypothetical protein
MIEPVGPMTGTAASGGVPGARHNRRHLRR